MSTTAKRNFMNGNARSSFNMKDNWNDYVSGGQNLSPNRQNKNKYQQNSKNGRMMMKGGNFSDVETSNGILAQLNDETDCTIPSDDSSLMINQDPAIAAIAQTTDMQRDENCKLDGQAEMTNANVSVVPNCCPGEHGQYYQHQQYPGATVSYSADGYSTPNHNHQMIPQQQQQYVWQSTSAQQQFAANDYASVAAANAAAALINTSAQSQNGMNTPANLSSPPTAYYTPGPSYQSYLYDPAIAAVSYPNMVPTTATYSPMSNAQAILSSPQQPNSTALFHTYQTPPPLTKYPHQLYMTPPASGSPSDLLGQNTLSVDRLTACDSPQTLGGQQQQQPAGIYTTASPYVYTSSYLTSPPQHNTAYQYQTPIMYSPQQQAPAMTSQMAQPGQMVHHQPSLLQTPTTTFQNLSINTSLTPNENKYKYGNNNHNIKTNHYNYKKNPNNKNRQFGGYSPLGESSNHLFSPLGAQSPAGINQQLCFDESTINDDQTISCNHGDMNNNNLANSPSVYRQGSLVFPPTSYMSPMPTSSSLPFQQTPNGPPSYDYSASGSFSNLTPPMGGGLYGAGGFDCGQYESYGDEFVDDNEPRDELNGGGEDGADNDEQLACQICRGRRMCFCYFLKVRYYKFPSFFDLVDHQYKKWRSTMATKTATTTTPAMTMTPRKI